MLKLSTPPRAVIWEQTRSPLLESEGIKTWKYVGAGDDPRQMFSPLSLRSRRTDSCFVAMAARQEAAITVSQEKLLPPLHVRAEEKFKNHLCRNSSVIGSLHVSMYVCVCVCVCVCVLGLAERWEFSPFTGNRSSLMPASSTFSSLPLSRGAKPLMQFCRGTSDCVYCAATVLGRHGG